MPDLSGLNLIVVEDMADLVKFHERWMKMEKINFRFSLTGKGGIELLRQYPETDLVLLDMVLPDIDGDQVFFHMRALNPNLPFIIYSAYSNQLDIMMNQSNIKILKKPFFLPSLKMMAAEITGRVSI